MSECGSGIAQVGCVEKMPHFRSPCLFDSAAPFLCLGIGAVLSTAVASNEHYALSTAVASNEHSMRR